MLFRSFAVITPRGQALIERVAPSHVDSVRRHFIDHLSPGQLDLLGAAYRPLLDRLRQVRGPD